MKRKKKIGGARMMELGCKPSQLWYTPAQYALVKQAAKIDRRPMTSFAIVATLLAAAKTIADAAK